MRRQQQRKPLTAASRWAQFVATAARSARVRRNVALRPRRRRSRQRGQGVSRVAARGGRESDRGRGRRRGDGLPDRVVERVTLGSWRSRRRGRCCLRDRRRRCFGRLMVGRREMGGAMMGGGHGRRDGRVRRRSRRRCRGRWGDFTGRRGHRRNGYGWHRRGSSWDRGRGRRRSRYGIGGGNSDDCGRVGSPRRERPGDHDPSQARATHRYSDDDRH
jgi:hypothetical protein